MGRLENIIARNQRPRGSRERVYVSIGFGVAILVILGLMVFTDLGTPPVPAGAAKGSVQRGQRVDGVLLRRSGPPKPSNAPVPTQAPAQAPAQR